MVTKAEMLAWLSSIQGKGCIPCQQILGQTGDTSEVDAVFAATGKQVGGVGLNYYNNDASQPPFGGYAINWQAPNALGIEWWNAGGIVLLSGFNWPNPSGGGASNTSVDIVSLLTTGTTVQNAWLSTLNDVAAGITSLNAAGVIPLFRPLHEMNGDWWWWGTTNVSDSQFQALWELTYDYLTNVKKCDAIWIYAENAGDSHPGRYPGDEYVVVKGWDAYSNNPAQDGGAGMAQVQAFGPTVKLLAFSEFGSGGPNGGDPSFDETILVDALKGPLAQAVYFEQWSTGWAISKMQNIKAAMNDPWMLTRDKLNRPTGSSATPVTSTTPSALIIMPLGDSVTAGGGTAVNGGPPPGSYRGPLYTLLTDAGYKVQFVGDQTSNPGGGLPETQNAHEGIGGINVEDLQVYLLQRAILTQYKPDVILLIIGNNDMFAPNGLTAQATYALLESFCRYIIDTLPTVKLIVSTVQPAGPDGSPSATEAQQYNSLVLGGITKVGPNISTVDISSAMSYGTDIGPDGVHPNVAGNQVIASVFAAGVKKVFPVSGTTPAHAASPNDTVIHLGGTIYDAHGTAWGINADGQVTIDGVADTSTMNVTALAYVAGVVWQENVSGGWWENISGAGGWSPPNATGHPSPLPVAKPTPTPTPTPPAKPSVASLQAQIDAMIADMMTLRTSIGDV
jgi:mannan endo-1,4-beta-mannosidase